jgi:integrase/recombinase XerD
MKCWHIPYSDDSIAEVMKLQQIQGVTIMQLDKLPEERKFRYFERTFDREKEHLIESYQQWLVSQRYSSRTIATYVHAIRTFLGYFRNTPPEDITNENLVEFNYGHIIKNKYSWAYQNQVINSVKLFYSRILKKSLDISQIQRPRRGIKLPDIFSREEVQQLLKSLKNIKHKAMISLIYACGLRRGELINLKVGAIESNRKLLIIKGAKGNKDRVVPLPESMIDMLRSYYRIYKPELWLFEGQKHGEQYSETSLREVFIHALERAGIKKELTLHSLRHSYATHLLENGVDLRFIQELLGHKSSKTTEIYTHVTTKSIEKIKSPFENLDL